jgi:serine/threonine-protein kinase RsbW
MENIDLTGEKVKAFMNTPRLKPYSFAVRVVMREGLTNAVRHGNKNDKSRRVTFSLADNGNELEMVIEDQGNGFDWQSILKKNEGKEEIFNKTDHGRGVPIMNHYVDKYWYNKSGTKLTIIKKISPPKTENK